MSPTHLANTFFELELERTQERPFTEWFSLHPVPLQLQFLPLLTRAPEETVLVTHLPPPPYFELLQRHGFATHGIELLSAPPPSLSLDLWGPSRAAATWAENHGASLVQPPWEIVRKVHSKLFSFEAAPSLPYARLLSHAEEAAEWLASFPGPKIFKKAFGASGNGIIHAGPQLPALSYPVIGEPWVTRHFDFSTQWRIGADIEYIGATRLYSSPRGGYQGTLVGDEARLFEACKSALPEHLAHCRPLLKKIQALGFFGPLGIDAFVYEWEGKQHLRPICEINARKTMGLSALLIQRRHFPGQMLHLCYEKSSVEGFLPTHLAHQSFQRQLLLTPK